MFEPAEGGRFTERSCLVDITKKPRLVDLCIIDREAWSAAEGWSPTFLDEPKEAGKTKGWQVRHRLRSLPRDAQMGFLFVRDSAAFR